MTSTAFHAALIAMTNGKKSGIFPEFLLTVFPIIIHNS
jgi:hypothetical protein